MTVTTGIDMPGVIRKLARIYDDHQLEALIHDYAADCRGLTADGSQLHTASELMRVRSVTNALVQMCEFCPKEIEPMVRAVLLAHPRRQSAIALVDEYARDAQHFNKLQHERERSTRS